MRICDVKGCIYKGGYCRIHKETKPTKPKEIKKKKPIDLKLK